MAHENLQHLKKQGQMATTRRETENPFFALQHRMNRMFDDFLGEPFDIFGWREGKENAMFIPAMNLSETDKEIVITADLPGIEEKDLDISVSKGELTIKGEKKKETEEKNKNYYRMERSYGNFTRTIALPEGIDESKINAELKKGVLKLTIPRTE
ncbi:MAG: Hsp20/alpha crystallin family protein, partial [Phycisphaerales bacterium]